MARGPEDGAEHHETREDAQKYRTSHW
jgi:hypothetical protein